MGIWHHNSLDTVVFPAAKLCTHTDSMRISATILLASIAAAVTAATTVNSTNHFSYGANIGWIDARSDVVNGLKVGRYYCAGYLYGANVGWINMGNGTPANGQAYANNSATDFGVNTDGQGNLRGYAWAANLGWINFEAQGGARVNLLNGQISGYCYSANCGWISLSNSYAKVVTDSLWLGHMENGMPVAWEVLNFGTTGISPVADADGDGMGNRDEFFAGTDPKSQSDILRITNLQQSRGVVTLTWQSTATRKYFVEYAVGPDGPWSSASSEPITSTGDTTSREVGVGSDARFFRIQAVPAF